jgi:RNA-directed DNA polymerase
LFVSFCPAASDDAAEMIRRTIRPWRLHLQGSLSLADLARSVNPIVRGWINYYGRFYPTELLRSLDRINEYLMRSATRKYKRLPRRRQRAWFWPPRENASQNSLITGGETQPTAG